MAVATGIFKGRWTIWILALVFALLAGFGTLALLGNAVTRISYYVVNQNVAARTQITADNTQAMSAPADSVPQNALTQAEVSSGDFYTLIALSASTPLTSSVVSQGLDPLSADVPTGFVVSSLLVSPENAAGGSIKRGDYVDIAAVSGQDSAAVSKVVLQHVLVLNVTASPDTVANSANSTLSGATGTSPTSSSSSTAPGIDNAALYGGIPQMYTFAVTPAGFAQLAIIRNSDVYLAISSATDPGPMDVTADANSMFLPGAVNPQSSYAKDSSSGSSTVAKDVQDFYTGYKNAGNTLKVVDGNLVAYDSTGVAVDKIDLAGGTFDVKTGTYTAKK